MWKLPPRPAPMSLFSGTLLTAASMTMVFHGHLRECRFTLRAFCLPPETALALGPAASSLPSPPRLLPNGATWLCTTQHRSNPVLERSKCSEGFQWAANSSRSDSSDASPLNCGSGDHSPHRGLDDLDTPR